MRKGQAARRAFSSNLLTAVLVGGFVGAVIIALVWTNYAPAAPQGNYLSFQEATLFGGSASIHSYASSCGGAAQLDLYIQNPTPNPITITGITISGSGVNNATVLVDAPSSNGCLTLAESSPVVPAGGDLNFVSYVTASLRYTSFYNCTIDFSNGQVLNQSLPAQS